MPMQFLRAVRFQQGSDSGVVPVHPSLTLAGGFTWVVYGRQPSAVSFGTYIGRGDSNSGAFVGKYESGNGGLARIAHDGAPLFGYTSDEPIGSAYRWRFFSFNATTRTLSVFSAPVGGTVTAESFSQVVAASGTLAEWADKPLAIGSMLGSAGSVPLDWAFFAQRNSHMSLAQCQAVVDDVEAQLGTFAGAWSPDASTTTTIPNLVIADPPLPSMQLTGAEIIQGPDVPPAVFTGVAWDIPTDTDWSPGALLPTITCTAVDQRGDPWSGALPQATGAQPVNPATGEIAAAISVVAPSGVTLAGDLIEFFSAQGSGPRRAVFDNVRVQSSTALVRRRRMAAQSTII